METLGTLEFSTLKLIIQLMKKMLTGTIASLRSTLAFQDCSKATPGTDINPGKNPLGL